MQPLQSIPQEQGLLIQAHKVVASREIGYNGPPREGKLDGAGWI
jgi:hypothetical protein